MAISSMALVACTDNPSNLPVTNASPLSASETPLPAHIRLTSVLLDFENPADSVFVRLNKGKPQLGSESFAGGRASLVIDPLANRVDIRFSTLISGRSFPAGWTLIGGHFWSNHPIDLNIVLLDAQEKNLASRIVHVPANQWIACMYDLTENAPVDGTQTLRFDLINRKSDSIVRMDNIELIDNQQVLINTLGTISPGSSAAGQSTTRPGSAKSTNPSNAGWMLQRKGYRLALTRLGLPELSFPTTDGSTQGWQPLEAGPMRLIFRQPQTNTLLCIYIDGRRFDHGAFSMLPADPAEDALMAQHQTPASISIPQEQGRLDRRTPGDANNDGYNEQRGAYQIVANDVRLNIQITPRTAQLVRPVLEIAGLPPGDVLVTAEGMLISHTQRLPDGRLLVMLPLTLERPTKVAIRLK